MNNTLGEQINNLKYRCELYKILLNDLKEKREELVVNNNYKLEYEWLISRYTGQVDELGDIITQLELLEGNITLI